MKGVLKIGLTIYGGIELGRGEIYQNCYLLVLNLSSVSGKESRYFVFTVK